MSRPIAHILVATDFGDASAAALDYAMTLANRFGASIHLLHVVDEPSGNAWAVEAYLGTGPSLQAHRIDEATRKLSGFVREVERRSIAARIDVRVGVPADVIRAVAQEDACDLIVMGTHGRHGLPHLLFGSVAEQVTRDAPCPVLTIRNGALDAPSCDRATQELAHPR